MIMGAVEKAPTTLPSTTDKQFLKVLGDWLDSQSEIMILVRYSRAGGNKSFEFFTSFAALSKRLAQLKAETSVTAFRERQLPLRGYVDEEFIPKCLSAIPARSEFLVVETDPRMATQQWLFHHEAGESTDELRQVLEGLRGRLVAVGGIPAVATRRSRCDFCVRSKPRRHRQSRCVLRQSAAKSATRFIGARAFPRCRARCNRERQSLIYSCWSTHARLSRPH